MIEAVDSITSPPTTGQPIPEQILSAPCVLAYRYGNSWPTWAPYAAARPDLVKKGWLVSVTLTCDGHARCYDIEAGGGSIENIGVFMVNADYSQGLPWLYTFASQVAGMIGKAREFGYEQGRDYYVLSAHAGQGRHLCSPGTCGYPRSDGTQYEFAGSYDRSTLNDYMLPKKVSVYALHPVSPILDLLHGRTVVRWSERSLVQHVDGALKHPEKYRAYLKDALYADLKQARDRVWRISHNEPPDFVHARRSVDWVADRRGARWQALDRRMVKIAGLR